MRSLVVLFAFTAVASGSYIPVAQPPHHPAIVLDPHGRPLDTAEVISARALHLQAKALDEHEISVADVAIVPLAHSVVTPIAQELVAPAVIVAPSAVSHQSRVDVHSSPAIESHSIAVPSLVHSAYAPLLALDHSLNGHGHLLKKRSLAHIAYNVAPSAVSQQSRVDIIEKPAVVTEAIATPVIAHAVETPVFALAHSAVAAPVSVHSLWGASFWGSHALSHSHILKKRSLGEIVTPVSYVLPSAVSHQSRLDIINKPAVVSHSIVAPLIGHAVETPIVALSHSAIASPLSHSAWEDSFWGSDALSYGHILKKRSLGEILAPVAYALPSAVSHQSRVDIIEKPSIVAHTVATPLIAHAEPLAVAHVAPAAVSHQARVEVITDAHIAPLAHSAVWTAPASHWSHAGLLDAAHW